MDLSRLNTLSLNDSNDIIANSISLINGNKTDNILDLFVFKTDYDFTYSILINNTYSNAVIDDLLNLKQNVIGINTLNINQINMLQTNLDSRALITNIYTQTETDAGFYTKSAITSLLNLKQNVIGINSLNINQTLNLQTNLDSRALITSVYTKTEN